MNDIYIAVGFYIAGGISAFAFNHLINKIVAKELAKIKAAEAAIKTV